MHVFDPRGLHIPAAMPVLNRQQIATLRILGRLEYATATQLKLLAYYDSSYRGMNYQLQRMLQEELVWRMRVPFVAMPRQPGVRRLGPPMRLPFVYGLTSIGKYLLDTLGEEPDSRSLAALKVREPGHRPPSKLTLTHDLQASWWCSSLLSELRVNGYVRSVFVQVEFVVHERQRMDALVIIRLTRSPQTIDPTRQIFADGTPRRTDEIDIRLALEIDRGTESLPVLLAKGAAYRDLHQQGTYNQVFGGPVLPVFLVPTARRAAQIAREWKDIWPQGWGVIATPRASVHPVYGVVWGDYRALTTAEPFQLLTVIDQHPITNRITMEPLLSLESWQAADYDPQRKAQND